MWKLIRDLFQVYSTIWMKLDFEFVLVLLCLSYLCKYFNLLITLLTIIIYICEYGNCIANIRNEVITYIFHTQYTKEYIDMNT